MSARTHFVYRMYNSDDAVIYVGLTRCPETRWSRHRTQKPLLVAQTAYCRMSGPYEHETAKRVEAHQIHQYAPWFNTYGVGFIHCPCGCEDAA